LTSYQREYILEETRRLFRTNSHLKDPGQIRRCISEAEARLEIGEILAEIDGTYVRFVEFGEICGNGERLMETRRD